MGDWIRVFTFLMSHMKYKTNGDDNIRVDSNQ